MYNSKLGGRTHRSSSRLRSSHSHKIAIISTSMQQHYSHKFYRRESTCPHQCSSAPGVVQTTSSLQLLPRLLPPQSRLPQLLQRIAPCDLRLASFDRSIAVWRACGVVALIAIVENIFVGVLSRGGSLNDPFSDHGTRWEAGGRYSARWVGQTAVDLAGVGFWRTDGAEDVAGCDGVVVGRMAWGIGKVR